MRFDALTIPRPGTVNEMEWSEVDWDTERWTIAARQNEDRLGPCRAFVTAGTRNPEQRSEADWPSPVRVFLLQGRAVINNALNKRLRLLGINTKTDHAREFQTTFSAISHHEEIKDAKA